MLLGFSVYSLVEGFNYYFSSYVVFLEWNVFNIIGRRIIMTLLLDWISLTFIGFVSLISSIVLMYRSCYMAGDKYLYRFIMLVYLFVISILLIIIRPNIISILLGWDGLGLVSYCLVIYYQNEKSANAGILTILSNRVGDVAILLRICWLANYGSWNFYFLQIIVSKSELSVVLFLVILAGMTKRAQIPFSAWLPAAMAAPTPVSALVHSSTLVTAGVYLLIRFRVLLDINIYLFYLGRVTIFISGLGANFEIDLKKIIALSTLRQLGVIIIILSLGYSELSFFHLLRHALFKSLLFLCAGVFIHRMGDIQDIRFLGGLERGLPLRSFYFVACSLSLCGIPFTSGFYSKDLILEIWISRSINIFIFLVIVGGTMFTVTYSVRLGYYLFLKNLGLKRIVSLSEEDPISLPIRVLFIFAISFGSFISWFYFPSFFIYLPDLFKLLILTGVLLIFFIMLEHIQVLSLVKSNALSKWVYYVGRMWFLPSISTFLFIPLLKIGKILIKYFDQGWLEFMGRQGINKFISRTSLKIDYSYLVHLKSYLTVILMILFFILVCVYLNSSRRAWLWRS